MVNVSQCIQTVLLYFEASLANKCVEVLCVLSYPCWAPKAPQVVLTPAERVMLSEKENRKVRKKAPKSSILRGESLQRQNLIIKHCMVFEGFGQLINWYSRELLTL